MSLTGNAEGGDGAGAAESGQWNLPDRIEPIGDLYVRHETQEGTIVSGLAQHSFVTLTGDHDTLHAATVVVHGATGPEDIPYINKGLLTAYGNLTEIGVSRLPLVVDISSMTNSSVGNIRDPRLGEFRKHITDLSRQGVLPRAGLILPQGAGVFAHSFAGLIGQILLPRNFFRGDVNTLPRLFANLKVAN